MKECTGTLIDQVRGMRLERRRAWTAWKTCIPSALIALGLLATPSSAWADCKINALELPVTLAGSRAIATLGINGTQVHLIVDSGAFFSTLTNAAAQQLHLDVGSLPWGFQITGITGVAEAGLTTVKQLQLQGGRIPDVEFVVSGNDESNGTMGLLGRNILATADAEYDLAHGVIRLMFPIGDCGDRNMAYWAGDTPIAVLPLLHEDRKQKTPAIHGIAQVNGKRVEVLFDSGSYQSMLSLDAAKRAGITDMKPAGKVTGLGRGTIDAWTASVDKFELGGETISNIRLAVADFELQDTEMLLGIDFFLSHRIYVSKQQRRMYFTYNGGDVFALSALQSAKARAAYPPSPVNAASAASEPQPLNADEPADAAAYARRGEASAARFDYAHALEDLDRACAMAPQTAAYFVRRGTVHEAMQQRKAAREDFDTALQLDPSEAEARLRRAQLRLGSKNREGALDDLQALDKALTPQDGKRLQMAALYERLDLPDRALPQWSQWIAAHPEDQALAGVLNSRCWVRTMLNIELDSALDDCDKAIDLSSDQANFYGSRAWLRLRRGELRKALSDFNHALKLRPSGAWDLYGRGIAYRKLGDVAAGQADIDAARKLQPSIDAKAEHYGVAADPVAPSVPSSTPSSAPTSS